VENCENETKGVPSAQPFELGASPPNPQHPFLLATQERTTSTLKTFKSTSTWGSQPTSTAYPSKKELKLCVMHSSQKMAMVENNQPVSIGYGKKN